MKARKLVCLGMSLVLSVVLLACGGSSKPAPTLQSIAISPDPGTISIPLGATQNFTATGTYSDGSMKDITVQATWSASDPTVVQVVGGQAKGLKLGSSPISVAMGSVSSGPSNPVTVIAATIASIAVTPGPATVEIGSSLQFTATATFTDGSKQNITSAAGTTWNSSNTNFATINATGNATGVAKGTTNITASAQGAKGTVTSLPVLLTVTPVLVSIAVTPTAPSVPLGNPQQFTAIAHYADSSTANITNQVTWLSSQTGVATINSVGVASTLTQGSTNVTASFGAITSNTAVLTVTAPVMKTVSVTPADPTLAVGAKQQFTATGTLTDGTTQDLTSTATWASSSPLVATITNPGGLATAVGNGTSTISAKDPVSSVIGSTRLTVATSNNGKLVGTYTFNLQAPTGLLGITPVIAGAFTSDGAGNISNGILDRNAGPSGSVSSVQFSGTYNIGSDGRGTISLNSGSGYSFTGNIVLVGSGLAYVSETDSNGPAFGQVALNNSGTFNNASVIGPYVVEISGVGAGLVGQWTADGAGNLSNGIADLNISGTTQTHSTLGTYAITDSARGRGTASLTVNTLPATVFNFMIYVGSGSLVMVSTDAISPVRAIAVPQTPGTYNNSSVSGNYVFSGASVLDTFSGQFNSDGFVSWTNGLLDLSSHSTGMQFAIPFTASYGVSDGSRGRFQTAETLQGGAVDNLVFYMVDPGRAFFLDFSSGEGAQGEFRKSTGAPYTSSSLNGSYSFYLQGCPLSGNNCNGSYTQTGVFTADGTGNITISFDTNSAGNKTTQTMVSGSYVVGDSGSSGGLITTSPEKIRFYFIDGTHLFLEDGDTAPSRRVIGEAVKQN
jgi:hypothetical protein